MIVYKETDEWHRMTTSDSEWQQVLQQMTTSGNEWHQVVQLVTTSGTASDNEWKKMTTSNKKWQWIITNDSEWQNELIGMRVSKIQRFYVSKERKGRSGRPIRFLNYFIQFSMQYITTIRTSRLQMFFEKSVLEVCNIHRKTPVLESLFNKVASLKGL